MVPVFQNVYNLHDEVLTEVTTIDSFSYEILWQLERVFNEGANFYMPEYSTTPTSRTTLMLFQLNSNPLAQPIFVILISQKDRYKYFITDRD